MVKNIDQMYMIMKDLDKQRGINNTHVKDLEEQHESNKRNEKQVDNKEKLKKNNQLLLELVKEQPK